MTQTRSLNAFALALVVLASVAIVTRNLPARAPVSLLNVSYDPTRELYARLNPQFVSAYANSTGTALEVRQAHGGSSRQARSVISGELEADVVTLALPSDVTSLQKHGLHVHLTWENEALRETDESKGALEIVYPPLSIRAEPAVAWVDANVNKHHTEASARAYLEFLFSDAAQEVIAESGIGPSTPMCWRATRRAFQA